jgi:plastocyanin
MANTIIELRHSYVSGNTPSELANGEIAINTYDGKIFYRGGVSNTVQTIERFIGPAGLDTEVQFNDGGVLGSSANFTYNKTTDVLSAKNIVVSGNSYFGNANLHEGITQLSVTNDGASAYLFDQYTGSNPSLYVGAGETISFNLNVTGHPFVIRESSGGANTSAGLTHISTTGVVTTGSDAQGKVSGVLFWKVPFSLVGSTYVYQCTIHGGMVGNIVIQQPASFVAANTTLAFNHANAAFDNSNTKFNSSGGTISGNVFVTGGLFPSVDNTGVVGNSAFTWHDGQFTDLTIDNILNVRTAIDLADGDILRFGTNDDWEMFHDGTANRIDLNNGDLTIRDDGTTGDPTRFTFGRTTGNFTASGNLAITGNSTFTQGFRALGSVNSIGDLVSNSSFNGISTRSLNLVGTSAVLRVARTNVTGAPAVELLSLNPNTAATLSHWDFYADGNTDTFSLRRRTGGAEQNILVANNTLANITTNVRVTGGLTSSNLTSQSFIQFGDGTKQFTANTGADQYARDTANASFIHANASFDFANTISGGSAIDNVARALANSAISTNITQNNSITAAFIHANAAFEAANTAVGATIGDVLALSIALG